LIQRSRGGGREGERQREGKERKERKERE